MGSGFRFCCRKGLGYLRWSARVFGGVAWTKWPTTMTGESPPSSRPTHEAERVTRADKAQPKRLVEAAVRRSSSRTTPLEGWQLSRGSGDGRERETQRKEIPHRRTMRKVNRHGCDALSSQSGPLSDSPGLVKKQPPRHAGWGNSSESNERETREAG